MKQSEALDASFRDPSGFLYHDAKGTLLRQVNAAYGPHYEQLMESGLYGALVDEEFLIPHEEVPLDRAHTKDAIKVLAPEPVPFVSYPYEWCTGQLQDAALLTLRIQTLAMEHGMSLKDASAYNVQFRGATPVFIDTLSFEPYAEGKPWVAYGQFCRHFLAPLALMHYVDPGMGRLLRGYLDGIPLNIAARVLPWRTRLNPGLLMHLHFPAKAERRAVQASADNAGEKMERARVSRQGLMGILDSLRGNVEKLTAPKAKTAWSHYYDETNYGSSSTEDKARIVGEYLAALKPQTVWDFGANTGLYTALAADAGAMTIAFDVDYGAVEALHLQEKHYAFGLLPLVLDLTNPSPSLGWGHAERDGLLDRGPVDCVMALALIHHLCIGNNVPLDRVASFLAKACRTLIVEFVPKEDSMVQRMLATREDVFPDYRQDRFETAFQRHFEIEAQAPIKDSKRTLYRMRRREQ